MRQNFAIGVCIKLRVCTPQYILRHSAKAGKVSGTFHRQNTFGTLLLEIVRKSKEVVRLICDSRHSEFKNANQLIDFDFCQLY